MTIENICMQTQKELKKSLYAYLKSMKYLPIKKDGFIFAQGEQPVLLVAHLDTVHKQRVKQICYSRDRNIIMSPEGIGGDDRCGIYMILQIIKRLKCSVLFCEDEEQGAIGAIKFTKSNIVPENINYIIELDRRGANDAVFYDCDNKEFTDFILEAGFTESSGSFSDISEIAPYLNIAAVNISSGYYNAHTQHEYINMAEVKNNINRVCKLIQKKSTKFDYVEATYFTDEFAGLNNSWYEYYFDSDKKDRKFNRLNRLFSGYKELMYLLKNSW